MIRLAHAAPIPLLAVTVTACSGPEGARATATRDTLPGGVERVRYASLSTSPSPVEVDLRIGALEGDGPDVFGDVRSVEAGPDGTIYVLDYQASEVRAFDAEGRFLRVVAGEGEGPGEIREANGMVLADDGTLWVQDHAQWMMIGLSTRGGEVDRVPMHVRSYGYVWSGTLDHRGRFWKPTTHSDDPPAPNPPEEGLREGTYRSYLKWYDPATEAVDSVFLGEGRSRSFVSETGGGYRFQGIPHTPGPVTAVDPDGGFWRASSEAYRIARLDARGDTVLVIEAAVDPLPVTAAERAEFVEGAAERDPSRRRIAEEIAGLMPDTKPVLASFTVDDEGLLWVGRVGADEASPVYDVFTREGRYRGSVRLAFDPPSFFPLRIRNGRIYTIVRDSLDVPYVVRAEVPDAVGR